MKKIITILAVLAMVAGFAFADTINVTTSVSPMRPTFGIVASSVSDDAGTVNSSDSSVTIDTDYLVANDVSISFTINQITNSRFTGRFVLKVKATDLVSNDAGDTIEDDEKFTVSKSADFVATGGIDNVRTVTADNTGRVDFAGGDGGFDVYYLNGKLIKVDEDQGAKKPIGTVGYTWTANPDAIIGDYSATITLYVIPR